MRAATTRVRQRASDVGGGKAYEYADRRNTTVTDSGSSALSIPVAHFDRRRPIKMMSTEISRLRHFLKLGGTLFVDDASPMGDDRFDTSFRELLTQVWTEAPLEPVSRTHFTGHFIC